MSDWHVPEELMTSFVTAPGAVDDVTAASVEQHLIACRSCRAAIGTISSTEELDAIWAEVADRVDRQGATRVEKLLRGFGLQSGPARLVAATPALRAGALTALGLIVMAVVLGARAADAGAAFLVLAPLVPTALVAMSFAPGADPAGECGLAAPLFGFGLVMRRAALVEGAAVAVLLVGSVFVPIDGLRAVAWVLPALVLSLGTLVGALRWSAPEAAAAVSAAWAAVVIAAYGAEPGREIVESALFGVAGQLTMAWLAGVGVVIVTMRRQVLFQEAGR